MLAFMNGISALFKKIRQTLGSNLTGISLGPIWVCHAILICWTLNVLEIGGWQQSAVLPKWERIGFLFIVANCKMILETDPPPCLWWNCWYFLRLWCFSHERVPKWLQMVLDYDLSRRNRLSTLFLSSILTRGWVALTFFMFFLTNFSTHWILHCPTSVNFMACNVCTAQNAVQDMASKSYGRLGVAKFLSPDPTNICLQKRAISPG